MLQSLCYPSWMIVHVQRYCLYPIVSLALYWTRQMKCSRTKSITAQTGKGLLHDGIPTVRSEARETLLGPGPSSKAYLPVNTEVGQVAFSRAPLASCASIRSLPAKTSEQTGIHLIGSTNLSLQWLPLPLWHILFYRLCVIHMESARLILRSETVRQLCYVPYLVEQFAADRA